MEDWSLVLSCGVLALSCGAMASCADQVPGDVERSSAVVPSAAGDVVVSWTDRKQTMTGFGAAVVFYAPDMQPADAEFLFSQPKGLGLSLLRVSIGTDGKCPEIASAKKAIPYGTRVWASSWTPPIPSPRFALQAPPNPSSCPPPPRAPPTPP